MILHTQILLNVNLSGEQNKKIRAQEIHMHNKTQIFFLVLLIGFPDKLYGKNKRN